MSTPKEKGIEANRARATASDESDNLGALSADYVDSEKQSTTHSDGRPSSESLGHRALGRIQTSASAQNADPYEEVRPRPSSGFCTETLTIIRMLPSE